MTNLWLAAQVFKQANVGVIFLRCSSLQYSSYRARFPRAEITNQNGFSQGLEVFDFEKSGLEVCDALLFILL